MTVGAMLLAIAVALLPPAERRPGAAGLVGLALGLAADATAPVTGAPVGFAAVTAGLVMAGVGVVVLAWVRAAREDRRGSLAAAIAGTVGVIWMGPEVLRLVSAGGLARAAGVGGLVVASCLITRAAARRVRLGDRIRRRSPPAPAPSRGAPLAVLALTVLVAAVGGHVALVLLAGVVGGWAAWLATPAPARGRPAAAVVTTLLLVPSLWLLATVSGPEGLAVSAIPWLPLSPAAERLLGLLLFGAVLALGGTWPLRQPLEGVLTAPLGALLLVRVALPAVADGLQHWRAAAVPLVIIGLWHASLTRRTAAIAVAGALLGLASLEPVGIVGAGWLLACAVGLAVSGRLQRAAAVDAVLAAAGWWGAVGVLSGGLRTEAVYTVIAALAAALGLAGRAPTTSPPLPAAALTPPPVGSIFGRETR